MDRRGSLDEARQRYAKTVLRLASVDNPRLLDVFATLPHENFRPPGP